MKIHILFKREEDKHIYQSLNRSPDICLDGALDIGPVNNQFANLLLCRGPA